jgi:hypothetical protein
MTPLKKKDLGGLKNHQWEETFGKRYNYPPVIDNSRDDAHNKVK